MEGEGRVGVGEDGPLAGSFCESPPMWVWTSDPGNDSRLILSSSPDGQSDCVTVSPLRWPASVALAGSFCELPPWASGSGSDARLCVTVSPPCVTAIEGEGRVDVGEDGPLAGSLWESPPGSGSESKLEKAVACAVAIVFKIKKSAGPWPTNNWQSKRWQEPTGSQKVTRRMTIRD